MKHQQKYKGQIKELTQKGYKRCKTIVEEGNVSKLLRSGNLHESYNKWSEAIETAIKTVQETKNKHENPKERY